MKAFCLGKRLGFVVCKMNVIKLCLSSDEHACSLTNEQILLCWYSLEKNKFVHQVNKNLSAEVNLHIAKTANCTVRIA